MKVLLSLFLCSLLWAATPARAAGSVAGKWDCTATADGSGEKISAVLEIQEADGKLSGAVVLESGASLPLSDAKLDGGTFTFKVYLNENPYSFDLRIEGDKFSGKYSGKEASGVIVGSRKA